MKYTQQEKLQTLMLCEIYRALNIEHSFDPDLIESAVSSDQYWALDWEYQSIASGEETPADVKLFVDTYEMFEQLKFTYEKFSTEEKAEVAAAVPHFNETSSLSFPGFDGNNETNFLVIGGLLKQMGRFSGREDLTKNSHMPCVELYQRMLSKFLPARENWEFESGIPKEDFIATLNARAHPEHR